MSLFYFNLSPDWQWFRVKPEDFSELQFIVDDWADGMPRQRQWFAIIDGSSSLPDEIQFFNQIEEFKMSVKKSGYGQLKNGVSVTISRWGLSISPFDSTSGDNIFLTEEKKWAIINTDDCDICTNGKYIFDETIQRTGHFQFKGMVVF